MSVICLSFSGVYLFKDGEMLLVINSTGLAKPCLLRMNLSDDAFLERDARAEIAL